MEKTMKKMSKFTFIRLCLSGAIAGAAIAGIITPHFGFDATYIKDVVGGLTGASVVAVFKFSHLI
jgi:uncharacterized membrane protein YeaQ/YmgE (transglycosylase-associated protein family)